MELNVDDTTRASVRVSAAKSSTDDDVDDATLLLLQQRNPDQQQRIGDSRTVLSVALQ